MYIRRRNNVLCDNIAYSYIILIIPYSSFENRNYKSQINNSSIQTE